nr:MAG TPA: hypothetical protein [Caudoviricetes sp.]
MKTAAGFSLIPPSGGRNFLEILGLLELKC